MQKEKVSQIKLIQKEKNKIRLKNLRENLRENLKKRKSQAKARQETIRKNIK